ncbi:hypothetical protein KFU94_25730 [Chloroflexi bacterium TSY]|nr:hypothetical protein [Chloroflexi bacterium TSY]
MNIVDTQDKALRYLAAQAGPLLQASASAIYQLDTATRTLVLQCGWQCQIPMLLFTRCRYTERRP